MENNFDVDATSFSLTEQTRTRTVYLNEIKELFDEEEIKKLYFDNVLIRENWAAIHYRYRSRDKKSFKVRVGDRMEFFQFNSDLKIIGNWIQ